MDQETLNQILADHKLWLSDDTKGKYADLQGAYLQGAYLLGAALRGANLRGANLRDAGLQGADLRRADLRWADLRRADLRDAKLQGADLRYADLQGADLRRAPAAINMIAGHIADYYWYAANGRARIGCQEHAASFWKKLTYKQAASLVDNGGELWKKYKPLILAALEATKP